MMFKKILLISLLAVLCLSIEKTKPMPGGYQTVTGNDLTQLLTDPDFAKVENAARSYYQSTNKNAALGRIVKVETQIVEGVNYKITFKSPSGPVQVQVWAEPWQNNYQVTGVYKNLKTDDDSLSN